MFTRVNEEGGQFKLQGILKAKFIFLKTQGGLLMKKILILSLIFLLVLTANIFAKEINVNELKLGYTVQDLTNNYFTILVQGVKDKAKELGINITIHDGKSDPAQQINAMENFIVQGVDAIIVSPINPTALEPLVVKAHDAGIPVIVVTQDIEGSDVIIGISEYDYGFIGGKMAGQWIKDKLDGKAEVAILNLPELKPIIDRAKGIEDGIKFIAPEAKIVAKQSAHTPELGSKAAEIILQAHPNVKVIAAINDAGALGAFEAVKAMGKNTEDFCIIGLDATTQALKNIKKGTIYRGTVDIDPYGTGVMAIEKTVKYLKNELSETKMKVPMYPVTIDNVDDFIK